MNQPINIVVTALLVLIVCASAAAWVSPDLLERWAIRLMARSKALRFSRMAYYSEYSATLANWSSFGRWCDEKESVEAEAMLAKRQESL